MNPIQHIRKFVLQVSQAELAAMTGTTQATVSRWENGELSPDLAQLASIRRAALEGHREWDDSWFFEAPIPPAPSSAPSVAVS